MKNNLWFWCMINTALIFIGVVYVLVSKDFGREAYDKCVYLEKEISIQKERCDNLSKLLEKNDTIVINVNYNNNKPQKTQSKK